MNAEIVAVGTELLLGQIANTNAQFISERLAEAGINVYYHTVVGDNPERLKQVLNIARSRSDIIIMTGGLGPTKDDLTKEVIAESLSRKLVIDQDAMKSIEEYYEKTGRKMTENNRKQALVVEGSRILENKNGMAPGMIITDDDKTYVLMPGVPSEMKLMFVEQVIPYFSEKSDASLYSRVLRFFGIGESALETKLIDLIEKQSNPTIAPYAKQGEVTIRLTAVHKNRESAEKLLDETEALIKERVGDTLYGYGDETSMAEVTFKLLKKHAKTLAAAESLTGGLYSKQITNFSGSSEVFFGGIVSYTNQVKEHILHVPRTILDNEGAVSAACAEKMAHHARHMLGSDLGISFTGVAGPGTSEGKAVGTVYIGLSDENHTWSFPQHFEGTRSQIRHRTVLTGFDLIRRYLLGLAPFNQKNE
ncbi:MAG: competence/damage-inducible protein A [Tuberibacillus sp.]